MEADESTVNSAASAGSLLSPNDDLLNKSVSLKDTHVGNVSEDEGFVSGNEDFEAPVDMPVVNDRREESTEEGKFESLPSSEVILHDENSEIKEDIYIEFDEDNVVGVENDDEKNETFDSVLISKDKVVESDREDVLLEGAEDKDISEGLAGEPEGSEPYKDLDSVVEKNVKSEVFDPVLNSNDQVVEIHKENVDERANSEPESSEFNSAGDSVAEMNKADTNIPGEVAVEENGLVNVKEEAYSLGSVDDISVKGEDQPELHNDEESNTVFSNGDHEYIPKKSDATNEPISADFHTENGLASVESEPAEKITANHSNQIIDVDDHEDLEPEAEESYFEEMEPRAAVDSSSRHSEDIDGQIVIDSEEDDDTDDEGNGKELFDSSALAALLKAANGADSDGDTITITSQDGSRLFSVERPAGLGSSLRSLRPATRLNRPGLFSTATPRDAESEVDFSDEEKRKLVKLQEIRVKFLRLVHRLGLSPEEPVAEQVLYRLALLGGRQNSHFFSFDDAKKSALELEAKGKDDLEFSVNILALGKNGVGKSATINSLFGEEKSPISTFEIGTKYVKEVRGSIDGVNVHVIDTPGLKASIMEQGFNRRVLTSVKNLTKRNPTDVVLYVDRLNAQNRDLVDLPLLKTITKAFGTSIWRNGIVTLTHAASAPPDGPSGTPLSYEVFVSQRSHVVQQSIGRAVGDLRVMSPVMNLVSLVENHPSCRKNREGHKILPNGQSWRPQLLLLCYSMKILSEASSLAKPQDPFDHIKLFGFRSRAPPLPYMLSSMLQSRTHPKLQSDQGGENGDSDIDLDDDILDSDNEEEDEYDQLPPFKPLRKDQVEMLSKEQKKAYLEEYDYRVKLLRKKQWNEELRRIKEFRKRGKNAASESVFPEDDPDAGAVAAPVSVPLPDMALPSTFDGDNPAYRYRFLEPTSMFIARPVLDTHGWDHDCGYDGVNIEHNLAIANSFPVNYTIQVTKDKKDFAISLDSSIAVKHGDMISTMANFDIQSMGKQLAYILRAESKLKKMNKHKAGGGISITFLGENVVPGLRIEDHISIGKQYSFAGSAGAVKSQNDTAYGANIELQRREIDYPIGQVQSSLGVSIVKWRGDLALGFNSLAQFGIGRNSKIAVRAGINNKLSGQITVRTSSSDHLSLALAAVIPIGLSIYKKLRPSVEEKYSIY